MVFIPSLRKSASLTALVLALGAVLAACETHEVDRVDYRDVHPLRISAQTRSHTLSFSKRDPSMVITDEARFDAFVRDYLRRGRSSMRVAFRTAKDRQVMRAREEVVTTLLVNAGVPVDKIALGAGKPSKIGADQFRLSYRRHTIRVPDCGDWTGHTGYNPDNLPHTNFGCSYQRNIGLMLVDPGDLVQPADIGPVDARRTDRVIDVYRKGDAAGSKRPINEEGQISDVE